MKRCLVAYRTWVRIPIEAWSFNFANNEGIRQQLKITHHRAPIIIAEALASILKDCNCVNHAYRLLTPPWPGVPYRLHVHVEKENSCT